MRGKGEGRTSARASPGRPGATRRSGGTTPPLGNSARDRGERTRQRLAASIIELIEEGDPAPTARAAAERAGVSVRLVFHHFADMDALYRLVMATQAERHWLPAPHIAPGTPLTERVARTVADRSRLFEAVSPVRRAGILRMAVSGEIAAGIADSDRELRRRLQDAFAPELEAAGAGRRDLLDALDAASSWEAWDRLRQRQRLSATAARRVVARTLEGLLHP